MNFSPDAKKQAQEKIFIRSTIFNPFVPNALFLYPPENIRKPVSVNSVQKNIRQERFGLILGPELNFDEHLQHIFLKKIYIYKNEIFKKITTHPTMSRLFNDP